MDVPVFDDSLRTGNEAIDSQHEWLFALSARVVRQVDRPSAAESASAETAPDLRTQDAIADAVYGLVDYITEHFSDEEELMASSSFPSTSLHRSLHEDLSKRVGGYTMRYMNGDAVAARELTDFFTEWLTSHIMEHDRAFARWLAENRPR